jgi:hypothetical protein
MLKGFITGIAVTAVAAAAKNGEAGTDRVTKDTIRSREKVSSGANSYLRSPTPWVKGAARRLRRR